MRNISKWSATLGWPRPLFDISQTSARIAARRPAPWVLALFGLALNAKPTWANPITFQFTVGVEEVSEDFPGQLRQIFRTALEPGSTLRAVFRSDAFTIPPDALPDPTVGGHLFPGTWTFSTGPSTVTVNNRSLDMLVSDEASDVDVVLFSAPQLLNGGDVFVRFVPPGGDLISDKVPTIETLERAPAFFFVAARVCDECELHWGVSGTAQITGTTPEPTPQPCSILLFAPAALVVATRQFRIRKLAD